MEHDARRREDLRDGWRWGIVERIGWQRAVHRPESQCGSARSCRSIGVRAVAEVTTDRERILELLRELAEANPGLRVAQIVSAASDRSGAGVTFYAEDRQLIYGLLALKKETQP